MYDRTRNVRIWRILRAAVELVALAAFLYMFLLIAFILI